MKKVLHKAIDRGVAEHDWLSSRFSFSFADYYNHAMMGFGMLRVLNDDTIAAGRGFGLHEHRNMEIISIPLYGQLQHKDSLENEIIIGPYDVQVMSAGTGVRHSEMNPSTDVDGGFLQIWIGTREDEIEPSHDSGHFPQEAMQGKFVELVKPNNVEGTGLSIHQDAYVYRGTFIAGVMPEYTIKHESNAVYVFLIDGEISIDDELLTPRDAFGITEVDRFTMTVHKDADILIIEMPHYGW